MTKTKGMAGPIDKAIGQNIRYWRKQTKMTQQELADSLGITYQQLQKYENAKNRITASRLYQIARILKIPIIYFYEFNLWQDI